MVARKSFLLRIDPRVHASLEVWARDELRSVNAQVEFLLRQALRQAGRSPKDSDSESPDSRAPDSGTPSPPHS